MEREQALEELKARINSDNIIRHSFAVEAIMRAFGRYFKDDEEKWAITGLVHDIDYEKTKDDPKTHGIIAGDILENLGADESIVYAIKAHNNLNGLDRKRRLDKVLYCANPISDLIVECALLLPSKKVEDVTEDFVMQKMDDKDFSKCSSRDEIKACSEAGVELKEFVKISLTAIKSIASEIEL